MELLKCPTPQQWYSRQDWCNAISEELELGSYLVSEQACALSMEVQSAFCAGAWIAVIVLAMAVIDAHLREVEVPGFQGNTKDLIDATNAAPAIQDLRKRRNKLVHVNPDSPAITVDQQWTDGDELENEARQAYRLMMETIYMSPGT